MKFKLGEHSVRRGVQIVEVFDDAGNFIAMLCPGDNDQEIRVISKYMMNAGCYPAFPPAVNFQIDLSKPGGG